MTCADRRRVPPVLAPSQAGETVADHLAREEGLQAIVGHATLLCPDAEAAALLTATRRRQVIVSRRAHFSTSSDKGQHIVR